jgi:hypothetical protein
VTSSTPCRRIDLYADASSPIASLELFFRDARAAPLDRFELAPLDLSALNPFITSESRARARRHDDKAHSNLWSESYCVRSLCITARHPTTSLAPVPSHLPFDADQVQQEVIRELLITPIASALRSARSPISIITKASLGSMT